MVYYGSSFAKILGIDTKQYFEPEVEDITKSNVFCCTFCHVGLSTKYYRDSHEKYCRFKPNRLKELYKEKGFECRYCKCTLTSVEVLEKHQKRCSLRERTTNKRQVKLIVHYYYY